MDLLPAEASVFVAFEDDLGEVGREVVDVGVGGGAHEACGRVGDNRLHPLGGQWGGGGTDVRVLPDTQAEEEVRPDVLDQRDMRRFIHPCRRMLRATQTVRFFAGEGVPDCPVGPRQLLLRRLPFGTLPRGGRGEHSAVVGANEVLGDKEGVVLGVNLDASDIDGVDALDILDVAPVSLSPVSRNPLALAGEAEDGQVRGSANARLARGSPDDATLDAQR